MKRLLPLAMLTALALFFSGCVCVVEQPVTPGFSGPDLSALPAQGYRQKTDTFYLILDASASMGEYYRGVKKFAIAQETARRLNLTIPPLPLTAGLQVFGPPAAQGARANLAYGLARYDQLAFGSALVAENRLDGYTPLALAIAKAGEDLAAAEGRLALIVVTDGKENAGSALAAAKEIKERFGDRLCIYPVMVGNDPVAAAMLDQMAALSRCGFASNADAILSDAGMADFVTKVFFEQGARPVVKKPAKPRRPVAPAPLDQDRDGVVDSADVCPNTPLGAPVDHRGCWRIRPVYFANDKSFIRGPDYPLLEEVYQVLRRNPRLKILVEGHASSPASPAYNMRLSERRARAVKKYFVAMGIDPDRIVCRWYGAERPVASNATEAGQAKNRRVEIRLYR